MHAFKGLRCWKDGTQAIAAEAYRSVPQGQRSTIVRDRFFRCPTCGEEFYAPGQLAAVNRRARRRLRHLPTHV